MSCGVGRRCSLDLALLWLWCRPAAAAPIRPLARESLYAVGVALKKKKSYYKGNLCRRESEASLSDRRSTLTSLIVTIITSLLSEQTSP